MPDGLKLPEYCTVLRPPLLQPLPATKLPVLRHEVLYCPPEPMFMETVPWLSVQNE